MLALQDPLWLSDQYTSKKYPEEHIVIGSLQAPGAVPSIASPEIHVSQLNSA